MSEVSSFFQGTPCWIDVVATDRDSAMVFYGGLFGWDFEVGQADTGFYTIAKVRGLPVAGIGQAPADTPVPPPAWATYFATDDADVTAARITEAGGTVYMGPMDVMNAGRLLVAGDPMGSIFGCWQPGDHLGCYVVNEPGTLCWTELTTPDAKTAKTFYPAVFGHGLNDMSGADYEYTTLLVHGGDVAGILAMDDSWPADMPSHWSTYFGVADTDVAVATAAGLGGQVVQQPFDSAYGRIAVLRDPVGATFSVISLVL